jgi:hypothetical protein
MSSISGVSSSPTTNFSTQPQQAIPDSTTQATSAEGVDKSSFGEADVSKPQGNQSQCSKGGEAGGEAKGGAEDIMKMLKELLEGIMKILGMDKKEGAAGSQGATNGAASEAAGAI